MEKEVSPTPLKKFSLENDIIGRTSAIFGIVYVATGLIQFVAILNFLHEIWGWWQIPSVLPAVILAYIPFVGSIAGFYAAYTVWAWPLWSGLVFLWPFILVGVVFLAERCSKKTSSQKNPPAV